MSTNTASRLQTPPGMSRRKDRVLWVLQWFTAAVFFLTGLSKFFFYIEIYDMIGYGSWYQYLTGVVEVTGAVALVRRRWAALAGLGFVGLAVVALYHHITHLPPYYSRIPIIVLGIASAIIAWERRGESIDLFGARA